MKIKIELDDALNDVEVVIKTPNLNNDVVLIKDLVEQALQKNKEIIFYKGSAEYFIPLSNILFFETDNTRVLAHTKDDFYEVKFKLYELENIIPNHYCRISKSSIINLRAIYSLTKSFSGASVASFLGCEKSAHISRHYYKIVKDKLTELRR